MGEQLTDVFGLFQHYRLSSLTRTSLRLGPWSCLLLVACSSTERLSALACSSKKSRSFKSGAFEVNATGTQLRQVGGIVVEGGEATAMQAARVSSYLSFWDNVMKLYEFQIIRPVLGEFYTAPSHSMPTSNVTKVDD